MIFAEISDAVWLAIIGVVAMIIKEYFDRQRAKVATAKVETVAVKVESMAHDIHKVEIATNSMKDQLVAKTEQEALARGGVEERARADERSAIAEKDRPP